MATGMEKISYSTIKNAAAAIKAQNEAINQILMNSKSTVETLSSSWTGDAADRTISAYRTFADKYSAQYQEWLDAYTAFLNQAAEGHQEAETQAANNASAYEGI